MLTYSLKQHTGESMYEVLYRSIRDDIRSGALSAGTKLPSKRSFARNLGVSVITVENAYAQLTAEGYITSQPKRGYFVERLQYPHPRSVPPAAPAPRAEEKPAVYFADFVSNQVQADAFPFATWAKIQRRILSQEGKHLLLPPGPGGHPALQQAIARHLWEFRGMAVQPRQIVIGAGTEYLYGLLVQLLGRAPVYGVEDPGYPKLTRIYESNGACCAHIPMDESGVLPQALEAQGVEILHISPSHHFPTGIVMPVSRRYELLSWVSQAEGRYIIEDDYDCEFRFSGLPIPSLQSMDASGRVIYINTFSKSLAPSIRISYLVLPPELEARYYEQLGFYSCTVSTLEQLTLAGFLDEGHFEKHLNRMRNFYRAQKSAILHQLKTSPAAACISVSRENEGLHFLLHIRGALDSADLLRRTREQGLRVALLGDYYHLPVPEDHTLVLNYAGLPSACTEEAIQRLVNCIQGALDAAADI